MISVAEGYTIKDMQQLMMSEQKCQREILEHQNRTLDNINQHLITLNGKVARHQETLYEKERGHADRLGRLEGWQIKVMAGVAVITSVLTMFLQFLFKAFF